MLNKHFNLASKALTTLLIFCFISCSGINSYNELPANTTTTPAESFDSKTRAVSDPEMAYSVFEDVDLKYTYTENVILSAGINETFETKSGLNTINDPNTIIQLFDPQNLANSWVNDDGGSGQYSKLTVNVPVTGTYTLIISAYNANSTERCDLYRNGTPFATNIAVNGRILTLPNRTKSGILNYFTTGSDVDTILTIMDANKKVIGYSDNYFGPGDFNWGNLSRIKAELANRYYIAVSNRSTTAASQLETTSIYVNCKHDSYSRSVFHNLKQDDTIESAPSNGYYNCISWAGGITDSWSWPPNLSSRWYNADPITAFDNFFGNNPLRYTGAWTYTRTGATSANSVIDIWANYGSYTHASVRSDSNNHYHGYGWESKPGGLARIFHPRNALSGVGSGSYGTVVDHYIRDTRSAEASYRSLKEAISAGDIMVTNYKLSEANLKKLNSLNGTISESTKNEFMQRYSDWKETWKSKEIAYQSNPTAYADSKEFTTFISYIEAQGREVWPLIIKLINDNRANRLILENILNETIYKEYSYLMREVHNEVQPLTRGGVETYTPQGDNLVKFCDKLLTKLYK